MKHFLPLTLVAMLMLGAMSSCKKEESEPKKAIEMKSGQQTTQTVYADEKQAVSTVSFTTAGAWTSSISEGTTKTRTEEAETRAAGDWISISPSSGDAAGDYTISITLEPNYTGLDRSATILITSGGESIPITVTQKAVTESGEKPVDPDQPGEPEIDDLLSSTYIPDPAFLAYCRNAMTTQQFVNVGSHPAWDTNSDGKLSPAEAAAVTEIVIRHHDVYDYNTETSLSLASLAGIEYFTGLTQLDINYTLLTSLDVSGCTALTTLSCEENQLTSLDVSGCTALTSLDVSYNQLTALDVSKNTALTYLRVDFNQLTTLDVSNNTALTTLTVRNNQLTALDVSKNTALTGLECFNNQLTSLDLSNNTALTVLHVGDLFSSLDLSAYYNTLTYLGLNTQLASLDLSMFTALTGLYIESAPNLASLDVSNNTALTTLSLYNTALTSLDLSNNTALTSLFCFDNQLTSLDMSGCTALTFSYVQNNHQLTTLDVSGCTALTSLYCDSNQLTSLDVSGCTALTSLDCYDNQLTSLDLSENRALRWLDVSDNQLTSLDVSENYFLMNFDCTYNPGDGVSKFPVKTWDWFDNGSIPINFQTESWEWNGKTITVDYYGGYTPPEPDQPEEPIKLQVAEQDFETDDATNYMAWNQAVLSYTANGGGAGGTGRAVKITNPAVQNNGWESNFIVFWTPSMRKGSIYEFSIDIRADVPTTISTQAHGSPGLYMSTMNDLNITTEWKTFTFADIFPNGNAVEGMGTIAFCLGLTATNFYFDNFKLVEVVQ
ncbi:MAG: leucine-rich repeat domain-containing protein [Rikenellaceae bacterium]|jgi:hypothetical protein|nr:leucine-rich repeat domain-containing protein [Rikenellaceae bacterium]